MLFIDQQVDEVAQREEQLQRSYVELLDERDRLHALLHPGGGEGEGEGAGEDEAAEAAAAVAMES